VADFVIQTDKQAKEKSTSNKALAAHVTTYTICTTLAWMIIFSLSWEHCFLLFSITFISHFITDYITSRVNSMLWKQGKVHNFFISIGFDQLLHYAQLLITFYLLIQLKT
jgi:hypothetical protein